MVVPILLYGCEVWGIDNLQFLEQFQLRFCKLILNLKASTPNCMIYGETGQMPLELQIKSRVLCYWARLINSKVDKISNVLYRTILSLHVSNIMVSPWISTLVNNTLNELDFFMSVASLFTQCFVMFCVFLYGPFCHGAHKLDLSTLFTTFFFEHLLHLYYWSFILF